MRARGYENLKLNHEHVAEFDYRPARCKKTYRMVVIRKNISKEKGQERLFDEIRYFFITNNRCHQKNLIAQLSALRALHSPIDNLTSNWAYMLMLMTSLAWTLKAWAALTVPVTGRWKEKHEAERETILRMEFKAFVNGMIRVPSQVVRKSRKRILRVMSWNQWLPTFFRLSQALQL